VVPGGDGQLYGGQGQQQGYGGPGATAGTVGQGQQQGYGGPEATAGSAAADAGQVAWGSMVIVLFGGWGEGEGIVYPSRGRPAGQRMMGGHTDFTVRG